MHGPGYFVGIFLGFVFFAYCGRRTFKYWEKKGASRNVCLLNGWGCFLLLSGLAVFGMLAPPA